MFLNAKKQKFNQILLRLQILLSLIQRDFILGMNQKEENLKMWMSIF